MLVSLMQINKTVPRKHDTQSLHSSIETDHKKTIRFSDNNNDVKPCLR